MSLASWVLDRVLPPVDIAPVATYRPPIAQVNGPGATVAPKWPAKYRRRWQECPDCRDRYSSARDVVSCADHGPAAVATVHGRPSFKEWRDGIDTRGSA